MTTDNIHLRHVIEHFNSYWTDVWGCPDASLMDGNLFLLTVNKGFSSPKAAITKYCGMHHQFIINMFGKPKTFLAADGTPYTKLDLSKPNRTVKFQPFGYAYVDYEGSRSGRSSSTSGAHVHALMMVHPRTRKRLDEIIDKEPLFKGHTKGGDCLIRLAEGQSLEKIASYTAKAVIGQHGFIEGREDDWEVFPRYIGKLPGPNPRRKVTS